jgi:hypothetical protein
VCCCGKRTFLIFAELTRTVTATRTRAIRMGVTFTLKSYCHAHSQAIPPHSRSLVVVVAGWLGDKDKGPALTLIAPTTILKERTDQLQ